MKNKFFVGFSFVLLLYLSGLVNAGDFQAQKPFDEAEFSRFMADYPSLSQWLVEKSRYHGNEGNPWIMSGLRYDRAFNGKLKEKGWDPARFFYLLDHVNMGLLTSQAQAKRDAAKVVLDQQREKMQARMAAGQKKFQEQMQAQIRSSAETAQKQWAAQRERMENNPRIPPLQKKRILAQMDRSRPTFEEPFPVLDDGQWQARVRKRQRAILAEQKRRVMENPAIPPWQKQRIVDQLERSMRSPVAHPSSPGLTSEQRQAKQQAQQEQWITARMQEVQRSPFLHPTQKAQMLNHFQHSLAQLKASAKRAREAGALIPSQENDLIKDNRQKLMEMFFPAEL